MPTNSRVVSESLESYAAGLVEAARLEIWEHITFWDDVYYAILGMENELAS
jgi:hypothetical protein